ncbi:MAG: hypothetical protein WBA93_28460 [Microcoleaceae cyanobacterium]
MLEQLLINSKKYKSGDNSSETVVKALLNIDFRRGLMSKQAIIRNIESFLPGKFGSLKFPIF